jgi:DNA-binding protein H-NS
MSGIDGAEVIAEVIDVVDAATGVVNKDELLSLEKYDAAEIEVKIAREKLAQKVEALEAAKSAAKAHRIEKIRAQIEAFGISQGDLFPVQKATRKNKAARPPVEAKYRGPKGEEWSGRGLTPRWLSALIAQGHAKEEFSVTS